jgi:hypothetical protein
MRSLSLPILWLAATVATIFASLFLVLQISQNRAVKILKSQTLNQPLASVPKTQAVFSQSIQAEDGRAQIVDNFLKSKNSPLEPYSAYMVKIADEYGLDYRLLAAIAVKESGGGRAIPKNSYNAWGWGIYGDNVLGFNTWQDGILKVAQGLKKDYIDKGYRSPQEIMSKYTPPSLEIGGPWAQDIQQFFAEME